MANTNTYFEVYSGRLEWHRDERFFTGIAPDLGMPVNPPPRHLAVVSAQTGKLAHYVLDLEASSAVGRRLTYAPHIDCANAALTDGVVIWRD